MHSASLSPRKVLRKAPTGIAGLDGITNGGLPRGRTTLLVGGPGSGKTVLALQFLVHGAQRCKEPGIFIAFEEASHRVVANAAGFDWNLTGLQRKKLLFLNGQPPPDLTVAGNFDLNGILAVLESQVKKMGARRIVFDALDVVLELLPDPAARRRETHRLHEWLMNRELTGIITVKSDANESASMAPEALGFMQFMVDCSIVLNHSVLSGVSQRNLRVQKYRGTAFDENESPFVIGDGGLEVAVSRALGRRDVSVTDERVSSGVERLDTMLGGGYYRGAIVLITGLPGTAKTTLGGTFAQSACARGERTVFVSFDSDASEVIRNLASVGIRLDRYVKNGCLRMISALTIYGSAENFLVRIKTLARQHGARNVVIDPISTLSRSGNELTAQSVTERLIDWSKASGTTLVCTGVVDEGTNALEDGSPIQISKMADTWIHLNYLVQAGERNRGMSIIKSRGTAHSNQVRELILTNTGVTVTDTYSAGGEVLMGTLRWEKESAERATKASVEAATRLKRVRLEAEEAELAVRVKSLQVELVAKQAENALLSSAIERREGQLSHGRTRMQELRGADAKPAKK